MYFKMDVKLILVSFICVSLVCGHKNRDKRRARLFSFNTLENDIKVNLEFSIPFLSIPVKKTMDSGFGLQSLGLPTVNLNPGALALGGAVVLGTTFVIPLLLKKFANQYPERRYSKMLNNAEFDADLLLGFVNELLDSHSVHGCSLRVACWSGQSAHYGDFMKLWDQVTSNKIISTMVNTTAVEDAMIQGRNGHDCLTFTPCPLQKNHLPQIMKNISLLTKTFDLFS
ncbi:uncharacterized protein LOC128676940 [Plodia interpunctella]|uniref:uncharacterized protein LOC128676940 n=1 Tax=Plodia interpunctella TaxID=58824 RepID=UPI002368F09B|nr:uncharacterized protein LOC128676940 [Plodia interpunctella]